MGSEVVSLAAAESKNPSRSIPRSIRNVYVRIFVFYVLGTFIIGLNTKSTDPLLGSASDASASPFVIAIQRAGIKVLPHIISESSSYMSLPLPSSSSHNINPLSSLYTTFSSLSSRYGSIQY